MWRLLFQHDEKASMFENFKFQTLNHKEDLGLVVSGFSGIAGEADALDYVLDFLRRRRSEV